MGALHLFCNISPKKIRVVPFVCAFRVHYQSGIFEDNFSLQFSVKMKHY